MVAFCCSYNLSTLYRNLQKHQLRGWNNNIKVIMQGVLVYFKYEGGHFGLHQDIYLSYYQAILIFVGQFDHLGGHQNIEVLHASCINFMSGKWAVIFETKLPLQY